MSAVPVRKYSIKDYLEIEESTGKRYEFYDGELFEVEGASIDHNRIVMHVSGEVYAQLKGKSCQVFVSQLKVESKANNSIVYPDVTIVCDRIEVSADSDDIVINPTIIIEVVSPSTGDYDHGKKFKTYRRLLSLQEYILISSTEISVEKYTRQKNGFWILKEYQFLEDAFTLEVCGVQLSLASIYRNASFISG